MEKQIFINLVVNDVIDSMKFYKEIGFTNNPQFSDESTKCMKWSDNIFVMLLTHEKFATFAKKPISDTRNNISSIYSLSVSDIEQVNDIVNKVKLIGGKEIGEFKDYGFMQQRTIEDLDGYVWEIFFMDISKFPTEESTK